MSFRSLVDEVIQLARLVEVEHDKFTQEHPLGIDVVRDAEKVLARGRTNAERNLKHFLRSLTEDQPLKLQTLMYCGRDQRTDVRAFHQQLSDGKEDAIRTMMEKAPLATYLQDGLDLLAESGVALEEDWN